LKSLNSKNLQLKETKITEIVSNGVKTPEGIIPADVIVLATGFKTNTFIPYMTVHGTNGTIQDHWDRYDGPEAYNCSAMSGFPNFFILLGPNSATGHTSALMAAEKLV
jgi:cation diffusion facilitator CzcD-associated flavoprotein CzcO